MADDIILLRQYILLSQRLRSHLFLVDVRQNTTRLPLIFQDGHLLLRHFVFGKAMGASAVENADGLLGNRICVVFDRSIGGSIRTILFIA